MTTPTTIQVRLQLRQDTAANWTASNPVLLAGELGRESDTGKIKIGTGSTPWSGLAYQPFGGQITNADISATAEIAVSKLADGAARELLQTDAAGTGVEWASNIDIPGTLDVTGAATFDAAVTVQGDLTVNGTTTTIDTANLAIEDKNIEIGKVTTPTDVTADGGGITLKGTTDKTINWVDATDAWTLSEHVNIASAKEYRIAGTKVLDATSLGSAVVSSSLTSVDTIGAGVWQGTAISKTYLDATLVSTGDTGTVTSTMILDGTIVNADINASAAIVDTKLATISTAGKVSGTAITSGDIATSGDLEITSTTPIVRLAESDGTATHSQTAIVRNSDQLLLQTRSSTGALLSNDYLIPADASGATEHQWRIANTEKARLDSAGLTVVNDLTISDKIIHAGDTDTAIRFPAANTVSIETSGSERARIDSSGRLLVGTSSAFATRLAASAITPGFQVKEGGDGSVLLFNGTNSANPATIYTVKSRGATYGTIVQNNDNLFRISAAGDDGVQATEAARIDIAVDGTPGTDDMPGRLVFSTNAGAPATSPTERMRIHSDGNVSIGSGTNTGDQLYVNGTIRSNGQIQTLIGDTDTAPGYTWQGDEDTGMFRTGADSLGFSAGGSEIARFNFGGTSGRRQLYFEGAAEVWSASNLHLEGVTSVRSVTIRDTTTASASNVSVNLSAGTLQRSTSSIKYKTDVEDAELSYSEALVYGSRPVWYRSLSESDPSDYSYWGFIAEEVAEIDPRMVHWGDDGPEGVQYERYVVHLVSVIQKQQQRLDALEARLTAAGI
jgi:hypothetical protein